MHKRSTNRREFLRHAAATGLALTTTGYWTGTAQAQSSSPSEKLNVAIIGAGNRGKANLDGVSGENIVAICDVDDVTAAQAYKEYPKARKYRDFRKMLDEANDIDAVVISTADHTHAVSTVAAMRLGKHVYCEKPLTHTVYEARVVAQVAKEQKVATQMGTQIHAGDNYRRVVELIQAGAVGPVREVHVYVGRSWSGGDRPAETPPVPSTLSWDLWLGPASERPYHPDYVPKNWRRWWDFGGGTLADMGCHHQDLAFWALGLRHPLTVEASGPPPHKETTPAQLTVKYEYPARGEQPPVTLTWYDGDKGPAFLAEKGLNNWGAGVVFIGEQGMLQSDYGRHQLFPKDKFADYKRPEPSIPKSVGHHQEWINACKTGSRTTCNFDYAGALTEAVLLGNVAYRLGKRLEWDATNLVATNAPEADPLLRKEYRQGWSL